MAAGRHGAGICRCPKHQTRATLYREDFVQEFGLGPLPCEGCGVELMVAEGDIDHADGNHSNNAIENLKLMHHSCHARKSRLRDDRPETKHSHSDRVKRINADPEVRRGRSERAKAQHAAGKLGRQTWKSQ